MDRLSAAIFMRVEFAMEYNKGGKEIYDDIRRLEELMMQNIRYLWLPGTSYIPMLSNLEAWKRTRRLENNLKDMIKKRKESRSYGDDLLGLMLSEIENVSSKDKNFSYTTQQDWQQKAHEEAVAICGNNNPTMIGMILNETMRLYPPGAGIVRDPRYWGSDANEFRPERFRDGMSKATNNHPYAFMPFCSGPKSVHWPKLCHVRSEGCYGYNVEEVQI
ncbi:cytochrome P450 709B1-like [Cryptomeria japonica]|uniref:cytochrome P450 709B1-like n=1 Tax=Cryptomeria japonica TaxID=3369 RepID=UPI0027DA0FDF|nr:cytochrome P450 709B1-like [Cryptomeria japonica]